MKETIEDKISREAEEEKQAYIQRRKERLENGNDIPCPDCATKGIIKINFLYPRNTYGHFTSRDGRRNGSDKEIECPRCKGFGQFDPQKDKLIQEIKGLITNAR